jgi:hypothetical protein
MTVSELIQLLSQFPADLPVRFIADDGYISTDDPAFYVLTTAEHPRLADDTLFIDIAG